MELQKNSFAPGEQITAKPGQWNDEQTPRQSISAGFDTLVVCAPEARAIWFPGILLSWDFEELLPYLERFAETGKLFED